MPFFSKPNNADSVLIDLIKLINPDITAEQVTDELNIHPDYPNLLALNDVLNNFGIESAAYRIDSEELPEVPLPFIAHTKIAGSEFLLVTGLNQFEVTVTDQTHKNYTLSLHSFTAIFNNVVLAVEGNGQPFAKASAGFKLSDNDTRLTLGLGLLIFIAVAGIISIAPVFTIWHIILALLFKTAGVAVSVLLLIQSIDRNNPLVQTLCGGGGRTNCNAILTSKAANVFEGLSWSEVGFFYFTGTWLALLFGGGNVALLQVLAILNIISLPYTIYSIYYQARVAKQWCIFCCMVQALLWLEFIPFVGFFKRPFQALSVTALAGLLICLALPVAIWLLFKPLFLKVQEAKSLKYQLHKFKYNSDLFNSLLKEQAKYAMPADDWSIVLGNVEAENIITMVSNPYCQPCAVTHKILDEWLNRNKDIQLRLVFTANNKEEDIKTPVTRHLMALNELPDKSKVKNALRDWYEQKQKDYKAWANVHPVTLNETKYYKLEKQEEWCKMAEIKATPTILVNGYRLPEVYRIQDIKYLLVEQ
ncbi:cysteine peptidase family C39 domain-containing protein [Mucilaginibacter sp. RB4R14]|uniref:vitamin K epoxide reductase family protein n=1 Tax=Mucilaginibacter aurantiaciroseus TaxID=2949308 RepID=UPI00209129CD|nr:vitamin K epoxide reductase family protein [Mucilaginibacter aurantiaciroseus]MCO5936921.1 cysteine peptidase family C39 domain-containing protein [Mucilaginibacter aurantiaciroseus]